MPVSKLKKIVKLESQMVKALAILHTEAEVAICTEADSSGSVGSASSSRLNSFRDSNRYDEIKDVVSFYMDRIIKIMEE